MSRSNSRRWLLYGANGYTGRLLADQAMALEMRPVLAGRSLAEIRPLAKRLGCESRQFPLSDPAEIAPSLAGIDTVLSAAGPFSHTSGVFLEACIREGVNYLDMSGEMESLERCYAQ